MLSGGSLKFTFRYMANSQMTEVMTTIASIAAKGDSHGRITPWSD
jgi:hypothetical protein